MSKEQILLEFIPEALDILYESETIILEMEKMNGGVSDENTERINDLFRCFHTLKGSAGLLKIESIVKLTHEVETLLDHIRKKSSVLNTDTSQLLLNVCDQLKKIFQEIELNKTDPVPDEGSIALLNSLRAQTQIFKSETVVPKKRKAYEIFEPEPEEPDEHIQEPPKEVYEQNTQLKSKTSASVSKRDIRVSNEKLDELMDMMGELVIAESNVSQHPDVKNFKDGTFPQSLNRLRKIVMDIQEIVLSTRMIPISGIFQRMSRLIRDLQKKSMKKVSLWIEGEETQIDKSIMDKISDPIIHILRNSVDHGIETLEERRASGKPEVGNIHLSARQSVNEIWILIKDDGRGLDRSRIIKAAIEKGILTGNANALSDKEVFSLIFHPGLSTAKEITDISGRGVGMDIVKQNMDKIGGKIDIHSTAGVGTTFVLRLPLTLGIMEGTVVRVGSSFFTIQTIELKEFVGLRGKTPIRLEDENEVYEIRGKFIPSYTINQIINQRNPLEYDSQDPLMIVLESEGNLLGIKVDEILGNNNVVIKPLEGRMEEANHVSGFTILGNGNVSLILDIKSIFRKFHGNTV
jgi:two-component system, chemotaxis family, sensor kinase CheA